LVCKRKRRKTMSRGREGKKQIWNEREREKGEI
jgi:hypothetical protein